MKHLNISLFRETLLALIVPGVGTAQINESPTRSVPSLAR